MVGLFFVKFFDFLQYFSLEIRNRLLMVLKLMILLVLNTVWVGFAMMSLFFVKFFDFLQYFSLEIRNPWEFFLLPMLNR